MPGCSLARERSFATATPIPGAPYARKEFRRSFWWRELLELVQNPAKKEEACGTREAHRTEFLNGWLEDKAERALIGVSYAERALLNILTHRREGMTQAACRRDGATTAPRHQVPHAGSESV